MTSRAFRGRHVFRRRTLLPLLIVVALVASVSAYAISSDDGPGASAVPSPSLGSSALRTQVIEHLTELGHPNLAPAANATLSTIYGSADNDNWSLTTYKNDVGDLCVMQAIPGDGRGYTCNPSSANFAHGPLSVAWGSRQIPGGMEAPRFRGHVVVRWSSGFLFFLSVIHIGSFRRHPVMGSLVLVG